MEATNVAVVGGGLVGSLCACLLGNKGVNVDLYELRDDIRTMEHVPGRSINLALSVRGYTALKNVGLQDTVLNHAIPMKGRLIHEPNGKLREIPYGKKGQCIYSVGRRYLNELLLTEAEKNKNVKIHFNHKLISCEPDKGTMLLSKNSTGEKVEASSDLIIGCDGAFSAVRKQLLKRERFNYNQTYTVHNYMELTIPATAAGDFAMAVNYLHIWPRTTFMLIALPNQDCTYTVTLFMPHQMYRVLDTPASLLGFFLENFPDVVPLIGKEKLVRDYFSRKPSPMISIKCTPYHDEKCLILGDAAHAMVPFYGQGMNAGFEDCIIFMDLFENRNSIKKVLTEFTDYRCEDAHTIVDLAMYNYLEMSSLVNSKLFLLRKKIDLFLNILFPKSWIPLYSMVTFSRIRYSECLSRKNEQDKILTCTAWTGGTIIGTLSAALIISLLQKQQYQFNIKIPQFLTSFSRKL